MVLVCKVERDNVYQARKGRKAKLTQITLNHHFAGSCFIAMANIFSECFKESRGQKLREHNWGQEKDQTCKVYLFPAKNCKKANKMQQ